MEIVALITVGALCGVYKIFQIYKKRQKERVSTQQIMELMNKEKPTEIKEHASVRQQSTAIMVGAYLPQNRIANALEKIADKLTDNDP